MRDNIGLDIIKKVMKISKEFYPLRVFQSKPFGLRTYVRGEVNEFVNSIKLISSSGLSYIDRSIVSKNKDLIDYYKVYIGLLDPDRAGVNNASDGKRNVITKVKIANPKEVITETYLMLDAFKDEVKSMNCADYFRTKTVRLLISLGTSALIYNKDSFQFVPLQDFSHPWTDEMLYKKYGLTDEEIAFIESMIRPME